ncbi:MAG: M35 family metallo-endopeptidase [Thermoanaerobaculum sp.]|nr:M35 family metallo-endopeptidase [Thermoanaerobaculum sp.]
MRKTVALFVGLILGVVGLAVALPPGPEGRLQLRGELSMDRVEVRADEPLTLQWSLTNQGDAPLYVLRWQTPLDGIEGNIFAVKRNGEPVRYTGKLIKRPAPSPEDFIRLEPGETLSTTVDITSAYAMRASGQYTVRFRSERLVVREQLEGPDLQAVAVRSNEISFWLEGGEEAERQLELDLSAMYVGGFTNCTNTQQSTLNSAFNHAVTMATNALNYLVNYGRTSSRYKWWFDYRTNPSTTYFNTVRTNFSNIRNALVNQPITFDCSCKQNYYAYVYPTQPYKIYLCNAFWSAPMTGRDSKAGTLVHEVSHFNVVAATDDWAYGATAAHNLAVSQPNKAIDNADNYEYFAEDSY